ncbi:type IV pilus assembly protein PilM [candidate division WWE3 bacterium]|uniref:Type IV pilus assembly protein PilM n=1 Tax=candidate division WWE3 bacterium TaxID=2053526 RepID=A0A955RRS1_UNCKA|nr:type IV pilus assembly protein PilM [candidate division WWE3 bacterium]
MQEDFFGLDIGSNSLKAVELEKRGGKFVLKSFGYHPTPSGAVFSDSDVDQKELSRYIREMVNESRISTRHVVAAFPESMVFTRVIEVPAVDERELSSAIEWQAEQYIPMPLSEIQLSWMVLDREALEQARKSTDPKKPKIKVLLVASSNSQIDKYVRILETAGLKPTALETEIVAISRALTTRIDGHSPTTLLMSIGASTTDLAVVDKGVIQFTRSFGTGGTSLARAISQELGFDMNQAEEYKKAYGLMEDQLEGKITKVIKPVIDLIVNEVERAIMYFQTHNPTTTVKRVVLTGGTAQLPGLVLLLADTLGLEVQIGNPWESIEVPEKFRSKTDQVENQVSFAVAVGLAMREEDGN